jgi:hypothetical protein
MEKNIVVSLFDFTGGMVEPWMDAGYECWIVDIQHPEGITNHKNLNKVNFDLSEPWNPPFDKEKIAFISAFPPCDHLAVSGARWFKGKGLRKLAYSINLFATAAEFCEQSEAPYIIENPVSTISTYWRKPDYIFHPHEYTKYFPEDNYTKKTCLWTGNGFNMPEQLKDETLPAPDTKKIHHASPKDRSNMRSITPAGFAWAVFESNKATE